VGASAAAEPEPAGLDLEAKLKTLVSPSEPPSVKDDRSSWVVFEATCRQQANRSDCSPDEPSWRAFTIETEGRSAVTMIPPGSLPGMISFATAPTTRPTSSVQMIDGVPPMLMIFISRS